MVDQIQVGDMVFIAEGSEGIGAVRETRSDGFLLYVENGGEFFVSNKCVRRVHDGKVLISLEHADQRLRDALAHAHDAEDPKLVG